MEEIKYKKTSTFHRIIVRKIGILKEFMLSKKRGVAPKL